MSNLTNSGLITAAGLIVGSALSTTLVGKAVTVQKLDAEGVTLRNRSMSMARWPEGGGPPDTLWEQTWICKGDKLVLKKDRYGEVIEHPAHEEINWKSELTTP